MRSADFHFDLPPNLIAQEPLEPRDAARLLVHELGGGRTRHRRVCDLPDLLRTGDLLILNDTRVRPARLLGRRSTGGRVELFFLEPAEERLWRALVRPARKLGEGEELEVEGGLVARAIEREGSSGIWVVELFDPKGGEEPVAELLERAGRMPLPPYIERLREGDPRDRLDRERYQTVYARESGAVAAPTAGLHFTTELLGTLEERGIATARVTLHVGLGTFQPLTAERVEDHRMHAESYCVPQAVVDAVRACRRRGGRVIAVGTTSLRAVESSLDSQGEFRAGSGRTRLFLKPGDELHVVDGLLTNFHLPGSTLILLVSAIAGRERTLALYREAIERGYRFYSYGDAMLLVP